MSMGSYPYRSPLPMSYIHCPVSQTQARGTATQRLARDTDKCSKCAQAMPYKEFWWLK